jgi:3-keto-5-aminohexanoate cleavage enzyme
VIVEIIIRKMETADMDAAIRVLEEWNLGLLSPVPADPETGSDSIDIENSFVALDGEAVVGVASYIVWSEGLAETVSLGVDSRYRGTGIGYRLQMARLEEMKKRGIKTVLTETDRPETVNWYIRKFGYSITGKRRKKHPYSLPDVDYWTVLELDLDHFFKEKEAGLPST